MGVSTGIDVSKQHLECATGSEARSVRFPNTTSGIRRPVAWLSKASELDRIIV